jgi:hypothetical protein
MRISTEVHLELTEDPLVYVPVSEAGYEYSGPLALADRSIQSSAEQGAKTAGTTAAGYGSTAQGIGNQVIPTLERDVNNAPGLTPTQQNAQLVAGEQGAGGAAAGITGQAGLNAMRTRNTGATSSVLDQAARSKAQILSQNALGVQNRNANLQQQQRAQGLQGLEGMYGTDVGAQLKSMGIQDQDLNTAISAGNSGWLQQGEGVLGALGGAAKTSGQIQSGNYGP